MQVHQNKAEADEQRKRRAYNEATRVGIALALSPEQVVERREISMGEWADWVTAAMKQYYADTPDQILPQILSRLEERGALIGREAAKVLFEQMFREKLGKALK